jgi:hypothetical protein
MKRTVALVLSMLLALPGCALQSRSRPVRFSIPLHRVAAPAQEVTAGYVSQLPVGRRVEVTLTDGSRFKAILMGLEGDQVRLQKRTRIPERPILVPLAQVAALSLDEGGMSGTKALLIGLGAGAATFFGLLLLAVASNN